MAAIHREVVGAIMIMTATLIFLWQIGEVTIVCIEMIMAYLQK